VLAVISGTQHAARERGNDGVGGWVGTTITDGRGTVKG